MFRQVYGHVGISSFKRSGFSTLGKRCIITGPTKTGSGLKMTSKTASSSSNENKNDSSSPFDSSFTFQLFLLVGSMGAGYTLGKTSILTSPPPTLFPSGSTTSYETLKDYEKDDKERENKQYDMFKRCALRILETKGISVDMKYGKNESLFEESFCSKDISQIMNDEDGISDVFFGKDPKEWSDKSFVWYPEKTEDVSNILKNCDEFKVPINSETSRIKTTGLTFLIDFKNFKCDDVNNDNRISLSHVMNNNQINEKLNGNIALNSKLNALDLFFINCGVKLSSSNNRLINNKFDITDIDEIECVLPDGKILHVKHDVNDKDDYKLFNLLTGFQDDLCLITKAYINKRNNTDKDESINSLIIVGSNDLSMLNDTIKELKQRLNCEKISIIDNNGCESINKQYGNYKTFAVTKVENSLLDRLHKKFSNNQECNGTLKIQTIPLAQIYNSVSNTGYLTDKFSSERAVIIKEDIVDQKTHTYYVADPTDECAIVDISSINRDLIRRLKLSVDGSRVLNRNGGVSVQNKSNNETNAV